jgi:hypothetical protein
VKTPHRAERPVRRSDIENGVETQVDILRPTQLQAPTARRSLAEYSDALAGPPAKVSERGETSTVLRPPLDHAMPALAGASEAGRVDELPVDDRRLCTFCSGQLDDIAMIIIADGRTAGLCDRCSRYDLETLNTLADIALRCGHWRDLSLRGW